MKFHVFLPFLSLLKGMNPEESMVYFSPTGEYFPAKNWPKVMASTSENQRQGTSRTQGAAARPRNRRSTQVQGNNERAVTREGEQNKSNEERILITIVPTKEEALKLIERLRKLNKAGKAKAFIEKLMKKNSEDGSGKNPKKGFRIWGVKRIRNKRAIWVV